MDVKGIGCQPIKPSFGYNDTNTVTEIWEWHEITNPLEELTEDHDYYENLSKNSDSKLLSALGTLCAGATGAALSFFTFKTAAPKGFKTLMSIYKKITNIKPAKWLIGRIKSGYKYTTGKISEFNKNIKPETTLGKTKALWMKYIQPLINGTKNYTKSFCKRHKMDKAWWKEAALNTGATAAAIPAGVTVINTSQEKNHDYAN